MLFGRTNDDTRHEHSDLARAVWGTVADQRGFQVARNRDRIGCYRRGTSYPSRATMPKVCAALSIDPATIVDASKVAKTFNRLARLWRGVDKAW